MKRTLSLVLALVMVLGSFTTVFAAEEATNAVAEFLNKEGVLLGNEDGDLELDKDLERRNAVVLLSRLLGVEEEAAEFEAEGYPTWEDVDADPYYDGYLAWAEVNEYFQGDDEGNFNPRNPITAQEFAVVLLRALDAEVEWDEVMDKAEELGLFAGVEVEGKDAVVRGQMANMIFNALIAEDGKLAEKLGIELPVPAALEVAAITADNLIEVEVVFNQEVDAETVTDANVQVKGQKGSVVLKEDGVTAVITLEGKLDNQKEYTLLVDKVKAVAGLEIAKTELKFKTFDAALPEALEVTVAGPRQLVLTFSEPIDELGKVAIKQDKVTLGSTLVEGGREVQVTAHTNFVEGKEYEVTVTDFVDYAGYKNIVNVLTFTYEKDENPPVATVEKVEQTYVVVSFDKPVKGLKADSFYHTFTAWKAEEVLDMDGNAVSPSKAYTKAKVVFYKDKDNGKAIPAGSTVLGINGKDIKDNWGNALGNQEFTISATADRVAPEVTEIKVSAIKELKVIFSKEVTFERKNIDILDQDGKKIDGLYWTVAPADKAAKEFTVTLNKDLSGKTVTISIKDVEDTSLFKNVLSLYTETIEIADKEKPEVEAVYFDKVKGNDLTGKDKKDYEATIYVQFSESVDAETALTISNYSIVAGTKVIILDGNAEFDVIDSRVKLTLTAAKAKEAYDHLSAANKLQVINVEDIAGNVIVPMQNGIDGEVKLEAAEVKYTLKATKTNQLVVEFKDLLSNVTLADFSVGADAYGEGFTLTQSDDNNKTTLTFDLGKDYEVASDASNVVFGIDKNHKIENSFGKVAELVKDGKTADKIKPEVLKVDKKYQVAVNEDKNEVTITFTEKMDPLTFSTGSFSVEGRSVKELKWNKAKTVVTLVLVDKAELGEYATVSYNLDVKDANNNLLNLEKGVFFELKY